MADKATQLLLDALSRAVHDPDGVLLHTTKTSEGLFPNTAAAKQLSQRCKDDGLLRVLSSENKGRGSLEYCTITDKGLRYLLNEANPKHVLEDFVRVLEARQHQFDELINNTQRMQAGLESLKSTALIVLQQIQSGQSNPLSDHKPTSNGNGNGNGTTTWTMDAVAILTEWQSANSGEDCPLPELFRHVRSRHTNLTIGQFHDGLRQLHDHETIYLHPWTGPLYAMPEPPVALMIGHEIAYYASLR